VVEGEGDGSLMNELQKYNELILPVLKGPDWRVDRYDE